MSHFSHCFCHGLDDVIDNLIMLVEFVALLAIQVGEK